MKRKLILFLAFAFNTNCTPIDFVALRDQIEALGLRCNSDRVGVSVRGITFMLPTFRCSNREIDLNSLAPFYTSFSQSFTKDPFIIFKDGEHCKMINFAIFASALAQEYRSADSSEKIEIFKKGLEQLIKVSGNLIEIFRAVFMFSSSGGYFEINFKLDKIYPILNEFFDSIGLNLNRDDFLISKDGTIRENGLFFLDDKLIVSRNVSDYVNKTEHPDKAVVENVLKYMNTEFKPTLDAYLTDPDKNFDDKFKKVLGKIKYIIGVIREKTTFDINHPDYIQDFTEQALKQFIADNSEQVLGSRKTLEEMQAMSESDMRQIQISLDSNVQKKFWSIIMYFRRYFKNKSLCHSVLIAEINLLVSQSVENFIKRHPSPEACAEETIAKFEELSGIYKGYLEDYSRPDILQLLSDFEVRVNRAKILLDYKRAHSITKSESEIISDFAKLTEVLYQQLQELYMKYYMADLEKLHKQAMAEKESLAKKSATE